LPATKSPASRPLANRQRQQLLSKEVNRAHDDGSAVQVVRMKTGCILLASYQSEWKRPSANLPRMSPPAKSDSTEGNRSDARSWHQSSGRNRGRGSRRRKAGER
jgi:hypothetical protein